MRFDVTTQQLQKTLASSHEVGVIEIPVTPDRNPEDKTKSARSQDIRQVLVESPAALRVHHIHDELTKRGKGDTGVEYIRKIIYDDLQDDASDIIRVSRGYYWVTEDMRRPAGVAVAGEKDSDGVFRTGPAI